MAGFSLQSGRFERLALKFILNLPTDCLIGWDIYDCSEHVIAALQTPTRNSLTQQRIIRIDPAAYFAVSDAS
jgi:hypothetical protein